MPLASGQMNISCACGENTESLTWRSRRCVLHFGMFLFSLVLERFRCTECIESIYGCTWTGWRPVPHEQVEERGGPSVEWPFEKFLKEMHKAILNDCEFQAWLSGLSKVTTAVFSVQEERKDELYATWRFMWKSMLSFFRHFWAIKGW